MTIKLKKFGTILTSRDEGREAYNAAKTLLKNLKKDEELILDFDSVYTFSPSWGDEFLTNLHKKYKDKLILLNTQNPSVFATLEMLTELNNTKFNLK